MKQKYMIWGFAGAVFLVTVGITSWQNGLWSPAEPSAQAGAVPASHSANTPEPIPAHPFQASVNPATAPPPAQITQSPPVPQSSQALQSAPQPTAGNISPTQDTPPGAPDPVYEQSQDDYKQRAKLMEELAARGRAPQADK